MQAVPAVAKFSIRALHGNALATDNLVPALHTALIQVRDETALGPFVAGDGYGTGSREHLVPALALAGRVPEAQEKARLFLAGNPN